jgi:hypothetical protein
MNSESKLSLDNQTETYNFSSSTSILRTNKLAHIDLSVKFQSTQKVDYIDLSTLAGFILVQPIIEMRHNRHINMDNRIQITYFLQYPHVS